MNRDVVNTVEDDTLDEKIINEGGQLNTMSMDSSSL